jgi:hypothetical protein
LGAMMARPLGGAAVVKSLLTVAKAGRAALR